ncbi:MAG TPA: hypothetical protein PLN90_25260, partial [Polyangiaceae bacterium]|nr:hypothetical protein [Polyangiaceae bacterium]HPK96238.1 hypothetical protein [Polyangiaceae bacterium]
HRRYGASWWEERGWRSGYFGAEPPCVDGGSVDPEDEYPFGRPISLDDPLEGGTEGVGAKSVIRHSFRRSTLNGPHHQPSVPLA